MLTPRRTMLLLAGFVLFIGAYAAYAQLLGWLDGLPQLPAAMLVRSGDGSFAPPERPAVSPTQQKLVEAFGEKSPETNYSHYEMQFQFPGESSVVIASGKVPDRPNSNRVTLTPFSIAVFGKPKPAHLRQPGEVTEISTAHADKGVLEFDRVITNPTDMKKAVLVRVELVSDFEQALPDPRRGVVHITNNQRSSDPNRFLVLRTVGPVFYRNPKAVAGTPAAEGPGIWTDAPVEIVDRQNLPRPIGSAAPVTAPTKSEENRNTAAVAAILSGQRLPPPTITAIGLRVYLEPEPPPNQKKKEPKPGASTVNGVRRIEFQEQVVMNLWVDNGQSLTGGPPPAQPGAPSAPKSNGLALVPPPAAIVGVTGGLGSAAYNARLMDRALLQIDTRGPFAYDSEKALARFDVVPHSDPNLPNDVQVTKVPARGGTSSLFSQVLELEFNGGPTGAGRPANTPAIKRLHAWTSTPGRYVTLESQDQSAQNSSSTQAYGQDLVHEQASSKTTLRGSPFYVVSDRNILSAGTPQAPATLTTEPGPPIVLTPGQPAVRKTQMTVQGAGEVTLADAVNNTQTLRATWKTSLVQSKEVINGREQDLFVFTDGAKLEDLKADYWLKGTVLKLWLQPRAEPPADPKANTDTKVAGGGQPKPSRVEAIGQVSSHSTEYDIEKADQLTVHFRDAEPAPVVVAVAPPNLPVSPNAVAVAAPSGPMAPVAPPLAPKPPEPIAKEPEKPKPPFKISAKTIETFVTRVAVAPPPPTTGATPAADKPAADKLAADKPASAKYQLDRARCEDNVSVHQDPLDPSKPRGVDIFGRLLLIDGSSDGSVMTVFGWPNKDGEVHQEEMSLIGPKIVLNQVLNSAAVEGRGALTMPTSSDLAGSQLAQPEVVVVHWRDSMAFNGALRSAIFTGKVSAHQNESSVQCHTMNVIFDRPIYFNQAQKRGALPKVDPQDPKAVAAKKGESAKIYKVQCYPAPADAADHKNELEVVYTQVDYDKTGKLMKAQWLRAPELTMEAQAQDPISGEKFQRVVAEGPGKLRIWQRGDANPAGPRPMQPATQPVQVGAKPPAKPAAKDEQEMKLTLIDFNGRMTGIDKAKLFQEATFSGNVQAISVPADSPTLTIDEFNPPPRAVLLKCTDKLVVWSHKKGDAAPVQHMLANGNAYLRTDDYEGSALTIESEGQAVKLTGNNVSPARVTNRFGQGSEQVGEQIIYDRAAGKSHVIRGFGGTIGPSSKGGTTSPAPKK